MRATSGWASIGSTWKGAAYARGSGTQTLVFEHTVVAADSDTDGISLSQGYPDDERDRHGLISGKVWDKVETTAQFYPAYAGLPNQPDHKVDGSYEAPLTLLTASMNTAGDKVVLNFYRDIEIPSLLETLSTVLDIDLGRFYAAVFDVYAGPNGNKATDVRTASRDGKTLTNEIDSGHAVSSSDKVKVAYNNIFAQDSVGLFFGSDDNDLDDFAHFPVNNRSTYIGTTFYESHVSGPSELTIEEGKSATYTAGISRHPGSSTIRARFTVYPESALTLSRNSVSFDELDWEETKSITVSPNPSEDNSVNTWARLTASGSANFTETLRTRVLIEDDD